jgi:hypothetical protein
MNWELSHLVWGICATMPRVQIKRESGTKDLSRIVNFLRTGQCSPWTVDGIVQIGFMSRTSYLQCTGIPAEALPDVWYRRCVKGRLNWSEESGETRLRGRPANQTPVQLYQACGVGSFNYVSLRNYLSPAPTLVKARANNIL